MKHLYAGLIVGGITAASVAGTVVLWWFLGLFVTDEVAALLTAVIILVMAATAVIDWITEQRESA